MQLLDALHVNTTVEDMRLKFDSVNDETVKIFAKALEMNKTLATLSLDFTNSSLGNEGEKALLEMMKVNTYLTNLSMKDFKDEIIEKEIDYYLTRNREIAALGNRKISTSLFTQIKPENQKKLEGSLASFFFSDPAIEALPIKRKRENALYSKDKHVKMSK